MCGWNSISEEALALSCPKLAHWIVKVNHLKVALVEHGLSPEVCVLGQFEGAFFPEEAEILNASRGLIREMYFKHNQTVLTFGRTLVPEATYRQFYQEFQTLGSRPIGEILLHDKENVIREPLEFGFVEQGGELYAHAIQQVDNPPTRLWGRRSRFLMNGHQLLIIELFFPPLPDPLPRGEREFLR